MTQTPRSIAPERWERIEAIRRQIAGGTYETPERLALAIEAWISGTRSGQDRPCLTVHTGDDD